MPETNIPSNVPGSSYLISFKAEQFTLHAEMGWMSQGVTQRYEVTAVHPAIFAAQLQRAYKIATSKPLSECKRGPHHTECFLGFTHVLFIPPKLLNEQEYNDLTEV